MTEPTPSLSLVILCYLSGEFAREFTELTLDMFEQHGIDSFEVILVGNYVEGSDDRTPEVVRELAAADPRIYCQAEPKQGWMGWDLQSGLRRARGSYIAFIDGDGQMPIDDVGRLYRLIRDGEFDFVKTYRTKRADGRSRLVLTICYNALFRLLFPGLGVRDMNAKPKIMTRAAYKKMSLDSDGWFIDAQMMIEARHHSMKIGEIPTEFSPLYRRASFVSIDAVFEILWDLLRSRVKEFFR